MTLDLPFTPDELAAIDAAVARQRSAEPDLTPEALVTRLTRKIVRGWADQVAVEKAREATAKFELAARTAPDAKVREALEVLGVSTVTNVDGK
jgi:hypothetical protein